MELTLNVPDGLAKSLMDSYGGDLGQTAVDRLIVDGYTSGKLSRYEVQLLLGHDNRWDTEKWLCQHNAMIPYTIEDLESDRKTLERTLGPIKK